MKSLERAGDTESERGVEMHGLPIEAPEVQAALMLAAYRDAHHQPDIDTTHWEHNGDAMQSAAMSEWVGDLGGTNSFAALYRAYVDEHPHMHINIEDDEALEQVLAAIKSTQNRH